MYKPNFFNEVEFTRCTPPCKLADLSEDLLRMLDEARSLSGLPFVVNSGYRSVSYEKSKGRKGTSSHCKGLAVDLRCASSFVRSKMLSSLIQVGFCRIGIYPTFLHVDIDDSKVSAVWLKKDDVCSGG